ncbi:Zc3h12a-like Ribonuclease NYN domain protein [Pseudooceanicola marinus]|uniref:Zc3h12a-like Ribonuclease NYN domain protein n=1 Tax=Pseudooceanicola marinus TaxID=396013 RepID=A0A1X6ZL31_9RHOB|nr:hypothetical protein [Pseudooceanicola marinus]SLN54938.1 Zc3h12a-like Ribonuclease NYN domain protein [Pseudooceanicola marinus]
MFGLIFIFALSLSALLASLFVPGLSDLVLLAGPGVIGSLLLLLWRVWGTGLSRRVKTPWILLDGSNIMHWKGRGPDIAAVRDVTQCLSTKGYAPCVVFDANVGYKLVNRYQGDVELAKLLGLRVGRVMVVAKGTPADEVILAAARDYDARVVTNDRFRDWVEQYPELSRGNRLVRGGYRSGELWLALPKTDQQ